MKNHPGDSETLAPILIVEDDSKTAALIALYLEREGFTTRTAENGRQGLELARTCDPSFVILDLMLPEVDGWQICREIRARSDVPILFLTAREEEMDRVLGFSLGADDYVTKPFSPRELVARVKAILRRSAARAEPAGEEVLRCGELEVEPDKHRVELAGRALSLTPSEYKLLVTLMRRPGATFSRGDLLETLYPGGEVVIERVVDVRIGKLRQKLGDDPNEPRFIHTVRGFGYRFAEE